ncbi:MAG: tetratricopeptide repeat protein [Myxococcota bacterium]
MTATVSSEPLMARAAVAAERGDTSRALELYRAVVEHRPEIADAWIAVAELSLRSDQHPEAIAVLLRAQARFPRSFQIDALLGRARNKVREANTAALAEPPPPALWYRGLNTAELGWLAIAFGVLTTGLLITTPHTWRAIHLLGMFAVLLTLSWWSLRISIPRQVAVANRDGAVHAGPDPRSDVRFRLISGEEIRWHRRMDAWLQVSSSAGRHGWIHTDAVIRLEL